MHYLARILMGMLAASVIACNQSEKEPSLSSIVNAGIEHIKRESLPGAALAHKKCSPCHYLDRNISKTGPPLKGVVGRAPTISGVPFAKWDEKSLDQWLRDPTAIKPGTSMAIQGVQSAKDRAAIIKYLKQFK